MREDEFVKLCNRYNFDPPPRFYERFVQSFDDRNMIDESFFKMIKRFMVFEGNSNITICKLIRFLIYLSNKPGLEKELIRAKVFGEQIGKRMQKKLEEYRDFRIKMGHSVDQTEYVPGENI